MCFVCIGPLSIALSLFASNDPGLCVSRSACQRLLPYTRKIPRSVVRINSSRVLIGCKDVQLDNISFVFYLFCIWDPQNSSALSWIANFLNSAICRYSGSRIIARICKVLSGKTCTWKNYVWTCKIIVISMVIITAILLNKIQTFNIIYDAQLN